MSSGLARLREDPESLPGALSIKITLCTFTSPSSYYYNFLLDYSLSMELPNPLPLGIYNYVPVCLPVFSRHRKEPLNFFPKVIWMPESYFRNWWATSLIFLWPLKWRRKSLENSWESLNWGTRNQNCFEISVTNTKL